jgi:hypothetical protein
MSKSKTCFEILVKKAFRWHLETLENQLGSIFKLNKKKSVKFQNNFSTMPVIARGWGCRWHYFQGVGVQAWCKFFFGI